MASTTDESVFNFDLNFLNNTNIDVQSKIDKQQKAILIAKRKTIATDSLIKKFYAKKEALDQAEKALFNSQEKCRQVCVDHRNILAKYADLEKEAVNLECINKELKTQFLASESRYEAMKSHANQLQILVKENEITINGLKIENKLNSNVKNADKKLAELQSEHNLLNNYLAMVTKVILGKVKLNDSLKDVLKKYCDPEEEKSLNVLCDKQNSYGNDNIFKSIVTSISEPNNEDICNLNNSLKMDQKNKNPYKSHDDVLDLDNESDNSNEIVSLDTGRGSSLAFSDNDKGLQSPDFSINNSPHDLSLKNTPILVDRGSSPINMNAIFDNCGNSSYKDISKDTKISHLKSTSKSDASTSPIHKNVDMLVDSEIHQKNRCLELNNSNILCDDSNDYEIQTILDTMRLTLQCISPIPSTPKSRSVHETTLLHNKFKVTPCSNSDVSEQIAELRDNYKTLQCKMPEMMKEMMYSMMKEMMRSNMCLKSPVMNQVIAETDLSEREKIATKRNENEYISSDNISLDNSHLNLKRDETNCVSSNPGEILTIKSRYKDDRTEQKDQLLIENSKLSDDVSRSNYQNKTSLETESCMTNNTLQITQINVTKDSLSSFQFEDSCDTDALNSSTQMRINDNISIVNKKSTSSCKNGHLNTRKLTKLEKMRKNLMPKGKIKRLVPSLKRKSNIVKVLKLKHLSKRKESEADTSATLNDKLAYEKAVKIMSDLKAKKADRCKMISNSRPKKPSSIIKTSKKIHNSPKNRSISSGELNMVGSYPIAQMDPIITTRSKSKVNGKENTDTLSVKDSIPVEKKGVKRPCLQKTEHLPCKRILRSSVNKQINNNNESESISRPPAVDYKQFDPKNEPSVQEISKPKDDNKLKELTVHLPIDETSEICKESCNSIVIYRDTDIFSGKEATISNKPRAKSEKILETSLLCSMLRKYTKHNVRNCAKKIPESILNQYSQKLEIELTKLAKMPPTETKECINKLVNDVKKWNVKSFLSALMNYLKDPRRKLELLTKVNTPPAPPMSTNEQALLYLLIQLTACWPKADLFNAVLNNIEYVIFKLNRTPDFDVIESMSHFYAVLCRYRKAKSRLRLFVVDAMYCIQFKSVPLVKQCMEVWMHILPLAHMGLAKSPLVTCLVYLLHFFKCEDRFKRVQEIRSLLHRKYFYQVSDWNESKIVEMFSNAILELKGAPIEKKIVRIALIILAKRNGPVWCHNNIIKSILLPLIEKKEVPKRIKVFCIATMGPLLKPYPNDMKVHCEIVMNQLIDMLDKKPPPDVTEAIFTSLIYMSRHNLNRVIRALGSWTAQNNISAEFEGILRDFIRDKPAKVWKNLLFKIPKASEDQE